MTFPSTIWPACAGSTFARAKFGPHETLSSDAFRALVSNDENSQSATGDAFDALRFVAAKRLRAGLLSVIENKLNALAGDPRIHRRQIRVRAVGKLELLPDSTLAAIRRAEDATAGYADQPHLHREVRSLAGVPLRQLASAANRSTDVPSGSSTVA